MEMNAVIGRFESIHGGFQLLARMPHHQRRKFTYVSVMGPLRPLDVIAQQVSEVGLRSRLVECVPPVRHRHIEHSAGAQHLEMPLNCANWILSMFEEMIGDDEILTIWFERGQLFSIVDDIHLYEGEVVQFRVMTTQVIFIHTINVGHTASRRNPQWIVQGACKAPISIPQPRINRFANAILGSPDANAFLNETDKKLLRSKLSILDPIVTVPQCER